MSIYNEAQQLEELSVIAKALIKYTTSLEPGLYFERQDGWWLPLIEKNFIGFRFQWTDTLGITMNLYGSVEEQFRHDDLVIKKGKFNYSRCRVTDESQLMPATVAIWRAHQLFHAPRKIETGRLRLVDEAETEHSDWLRPRPKESGISGHDLNGLTATREWYDEVRDFMKKNKLIDSSIIT